jgi:hypothetical protein
LLHNAAQWRASCNAAAQFCQAGGDSWKKREYLLDWTWQRLGTPLLLLKSDVEGGQIFCEINADTRSVRRMVAKLEKHKAAQ